MLYDLYGIENKRLHHYIFNLAKQRGIMDVDSSWDSLAREGILLLGRDAVKTRGLACDIHFAIQPKFDTSYAQGIKMEEDLNEQYVRAQNSFILQGLSGLDVALHIVLLSVGPNEILERRKYEQKFLGKKPRSLNIQSIKKEVIYEEKFFKEISAEARRYVSTQARIVNNKKGKLLLALEEIVSFTGLKK